MTSPTPQEDGSPLTTPSFGGEVLDSGMLADLSRWGEFDIRAWGERNSKEKRWPSILSAAKELRSKYNRTASLGFCYGGWSSFCLASKELNPPNQEPLVNCISIGHPTWLTKEEIDAVAVPVQIVAPEIDPVFTRELREYAWKSISHKDLPLDYLHIPGVEHSFCTRGNPEDKRECRAMERSKRAQVAWLNEWLHGDKEW
jgi:dienelactone hydrolase